MWDDGTLGTILHNTRGGEIYEILWTIQSCVCHILSKTGDTELIQEKVEPIILNLHLKKSLFPCILIHWCISKCIVQCLADVSLASHCTHSCLLYLSVSAPCPPVSLLSGNIFYPISDWVSNSQNADSGNNLSSIIYNTDELNGRPVYKHIEHDVIAISFLCLELESALVCCCKTLTSEALFRMDQVILG